MRLLFVGAVLLATVSAAQSNPGQNYDREWDDFRAPFSATGPTAKWFYFSAGPYVGNDGIETNLPGGRFNVKPKGINPTTGKPAFTNTIGQDSVNGGLPGGLDHVKWLVYTNNLSSSGFPGFDAVPGKELSCEVRIKGRTYGVNQNPFGALIDDPQSDMRLASFALNTIDFETFMVFDFFITNDIIYAFYERLPFGRGPVLGNYASFSHIFPVAARRVGDEDKVRIGYDRAAGKVRWYVNNRQVFEVDRIGFRLERPLLTLDHGGVEGIVEMKQMACGMGLFTLLDAYRPTDLGLVKLSDAPNFYFDPDLGEPTLAAFFDDYSQAGNRLWGQGAEMTVRDFRVSSLPVRRDCH